MHQQLLSTFVCVATILNAGRTVSLVQAEMERCQAAEAKVLQQQQVAPLLGLLWTVHVLSTCGHYLLHSISNVLVEMPQADILNINHSVVLHADGQGKAASLVTSNGTPVHRPRQAGSRQPAGQQ